MKNKEASTEYLYILAWEIMMGSVTSYAFVQAHNAKEDKAPLDSVYCIQSGRNRQWITIDDISPGTRSIIEEIHSQLLKQVNSKSKK